MESEKFSRASRRKFRKLWRSAARKSDPVIVARLGVGHYPSRAEAAARRNLVATFYGLDTELPV